MTFLTHRQRQLCDKTFPSISTGFVGKRLSKIPIYILVTKHFIIILNCPSVLVAVTAVQITWRFSTGVELHYMVKYGHAHC